MEMVNLFYVCSFFPGERRLNLTLFLYMNLILLQLVPYWCIWSLAVLKFMRFYSPWCPMHSSSSSPLMFLFVNHLILKVIKWELNVDYRYQNHWCN
jgi:hypothetical protein